MNSSPRYAWFNGKIVNWENCVLHARMQGAFWGSNVFEGIRAYWQEEQQCLQIFRLDDHLQRLAASMKSLRMKLPYTAKDIRFACTELLRANRFSEDVHMVVSGYFGMGPNCDSMSLIEEAGMHITAVPAPRSPRFYNGATAAISSWRRLSDDVMPPRIKTGANYHNNRLAQQEAVRNGYDTALFLNQAGKIAEAPGSCVLMLRDNKIVTPPATCGVLEGITLSTVLELAGSVLGIPIQAREIDRSELYIADEVLLCGTLGEIQPVVAVDGIKVGSGKPGTVAKRVQGLYDDVVRVYPREKWSIGVNTNHPVSTAAITGRRAATATCLSQEAS